MPTKRRARVHRRRPQLTAVQRAFLLDEPLPELLSDEDQWWLIVEAGADREDSPWRSARELWVQYRAELLASFVAEQPGHRPSCWWTFEAPRQPPGRFAGWYYDGKLPEPRLQLGGSGRTSWDAGYATGPCYLRGVPRVMVDIDDDDPPLFEAEATYLRRHGLLLPGEARRLKPTDFEPVTWTVEEFGYVWRDETKQPAPPGR